VRTHAHDAIERGVVLVDTSGSKAGQINGLSLAQKSGFSFARPVRITARVHLGQGRVTDIEREATLGGPMHSKGVMILWGYLAGRFAEDAPLALAATLVFEQSYDAVDGDSASAAELFALLSALADAPLRQDLAVTGSVNQWGEIQAVGGVNEKIEGFFDVCAARGLSGSQGVLIPEANRQHLMLREDVVAAVREGRFNVSTIKTVDEGIALMTGLEAGQKGADGFGAATVNGRVAARLRAFAERSRAFAAGRERADAAPSGSASA
jgi:predicted ATP-dependent protease